jgi:SAM-dependent methyltransferase
MEGEQLERLYRARFGGQAAARRRLWRVLCRHFFDRYVPPGGTVVDLGAGHCEFLHAVRAGRRIAVDKNPDTGRAAGPGVEVLAIEAEALPEDLAGVADLVFASNVLEHLDSREQVLAVLAAARRTLRPGGRLVVLGPNIRFAHDVYWDFFDHKIALSDRSVVEAVEASGLTVLEVRPRFLPYTSKSRLPSWPLLVRLYLLLRPLQWLLGRQMLVVARRP